VTLGTAITRYGLSGGEHALAEPKNGARADRARREVETCLAVLEGRLEQHPFVLGSGYSLADLVAGNVVRYGVVCRLSTTGFERVSSWLASCLSRPAPKREWSRVPSHLRRGEPPGRAPLDFAELRV
jgi:glutathione S-transferase